MSPVGPAPGHDDGTNQGEAPARPSTVPQNKLLALSEKPAEHRALLALGLLAECGLAVELVLTAIDQGMYEEWDIGLFEGIQEGFGGTELELATKAGRDWLVYTIDHQEERK